MKNLVRILFLYFLTSNAWAQQSPDPNCPLDYFYRGYDMVKGNPVSNNYDPGWRLAIMQESPSDVCLTCTAATTCAADYQYHEMNTTFDYYTSLTAYTFLSGDSEDFFKSSSFSGSAEYYYQQQDVFGIGLVNIQAEGACQLYEGGRDLHCYEVEFLSGFLNFVADLPTSTTDEEWYEVVLEFFNNYGTHIVGNEMSLGARWSYESLFTKLEYEGLRSANVDIQLGAETSAEYFRTKGASAEFESVQATEARLAFEDVTDSQRAIFLGAPPPSELSFGAWVDEIENPIPQRYKMTPISELFTSRFFPNDPDIAKKREVLEMGYINYIPKPPKIVHVFDSEEGKYQTKNSLAVSCPADYQLISGGCKTETNPDDVKFWILASLKPENNSFNCIANMDYVEDSSAHRYYKGLDVSGTCLHDDYIDERVIAECTGAVGNTGSECIAQCPVGFDVTGGGCESNSAQETKPWKVVRSSPVYNSSADWSGWSCRMNRDQDSGIANKFATGYALCVKYVDNALSDKKIITQRSGTANRDYNGNVVNCAAGYEILSGGCIVPAQGDTPNEWKTVESLPLGNQSWSCYAQRDSSISSTTFNQDVQTDALCVKYNELN